MAALRKETPSKSSFFSSPSHALKKIVCGTVGGFQKPQKREGVEEVEPVRETTPEPHAPAFQTVASEDEVESSADDEADAIFSYSSDENYPRPRIREDLLPHDFSQWQKSPSGSVAYSTVSEVSSTSKETETFSEVLSTSTSATSQERHSDNGRSKRFTVPISTDLPDRTLSCRNGSSTDRDLRDSASLKSKRNGQVSGAKVFTRYDVNAGLRSMPENRKGWVSGGTQWNGINERAAAGGELRQMMLELAGTREGGNADTELYQNLIEMFPLIETFVEHPECRHHRKFQHHASMVYTRAPDRNAYVKKIAVAKNLRDHGRVNGRSKSVWEDLKADKSSLSPCEDNSIGAECAKLQGEVMELQRKLAERDALLEATVAHENAEAMALERILKNLQREVAEKERLWETAKEKLVQKENEINGIEDRLKRTEESYAGLRERSASSEEEVMSLRCEVAALRWQMEVESQETQLDSSPQSGSVQKMTGKAMRPSDVVTEKQQEMDREEMEAARKMYLAAIVAAKHNPLEECLALVGELRMHLQSFLRRSTFRGGEVIPCSR